MTESKENIALAFALTCAAGLSTTIGATLSFCIRPSLTSILPISLAFSSGIMIYVSFVEILSEGLHSFQIQLIKSHPNSYEYFGGIMIGYVIDIISHLLGYKHNEYKNTSVSEAEIEPEYTNDTHEDIEIENKIINIKMDDINENDSNNKELIKLSLKAAFAIAIHNFPEGIATFVAALANPTLGVSIAVAVAIHNIPEGITIAMPIYFATQSKCKAFLWSFLSGIFEPIGGLIGYLIIDSMFNEIVFGVLFGFTAGIMIYLSFKELLPMARKKDINDKYCTILVFIGFFVMDISLVLFEYAIV